MSFWVIFLMARTVPPSFVEIGPKLRVVAPLMRRWPKTAKNRGARPKNNVNKVTRWVFRYVGNKTFDFSSKKRIFCPKTTKFGQNWHFLSFWARPCRLIQYPVGGSVGGCGTRAVSRKTPMYFIICTPGCWKYKSLSVHKHQYKWRG